MIRYNFQVTNYRSVLKEFARLLNLEVRKKKLVFPPHIGKGYIFASNISDDISYIIINATLKHDLMLIRKKTISFGLSLSFNQIAISDYLKLTGMNDSITDTSSFLNNIYLSSTNTELELTFSAGSEIKMVVVLFSPTLIKKSVKKAILLNLQLYTDLGLQNMYREPITFAYRSLLDDIFNNDTDSPISNLVLQNRILLLTEKFLAAFLERDSKRDTVKSRKLKEKDAQALMDVEEILTKASLDKFPSIEVLSKTARMSSTKLKTKFKSVYGMKLYEYYNRNRLEKAKDLLQSGKYSVKEVGMDIGFSNLSNFAKAFKKEFGILPNEMLKS